MLVDGKFTSRRHTLFGNFVCEHNFGRNFLALTIFPHLDHEDLGPVGPNSAPNLLEETRRFGKKRSVGRPGDRREVGDIVREHVARCLEVFGFGLADIVFGLLNGLRVNDRRLDGSRHLNLLGEHLTPNGELDVSVVKGVAVQDKLLLDGLPLVGLQVLGAGKCKETIPRAPDVL